MIFYQFENGKCLSFISGTDIPGDPTCTRARMEAWVAESPSTRELVTTAEPPPAPARYLKKGPTGVRVMSASEKSEVDNVRKSKEDSVRAEIRSKLVGLGFSSAAAAAVANSVKVPRR